MQMPESITVGWRLSGQKAVNRMMKIRLQLESEQRERCAGQIKDYVTSVSMSLQRCSTTLELKPEESRQAEMRLRA
jgi:hypothetical protein